MLPIAKCLEIIQVEVDAGTLQLSMLGASIFVALVALEFVKAGIEAAAGRGFTLDKTLYLYLFLAILYLAYPELQGHLKDFNEDYCKSIYTAFGGLNVSFEPTRQVGRMVLASVVLNFGGLPFNVGPILIVLLVLVIALIVGLVAMVAVDIIVLTLFLGFEIVLLTGPFFIPFFMSSDMNHIAKQWLNNLLMYMVQFPLVALAFRIVAMLNTQLAENIVNKGLTPGIHLQTIYTMIFIPLFGLGMVWQATTLAKSLFPPAGGFLGANVGAPIAAGMAYVLNSVAKAAGGVARAGLKGRE